MDEILSKHCSALGRDDKRARKIALDELAKELFVIESGLLAEDKVGYVYKDVLRCLNDKSEAVREAAVNLLTRIFKETSQTDGQPFLPYLIPVLAQRVGKLELVESSEEVRLLLVGLLRVTVDKFHQQLAPYMDDVIKILVQTLVDPYPQVKKESCDCAAQLAQLIPQHFHQQSESLIEPALQACQHQHSKVRIAAILCIGNVVRYGDNKAVPKTSGILAQRLFDQSPPVRQAVGQVAAMWLTQLPDRYSYFHTILPLQLTSQSDELPELREEATQLWLSVGEQYYQENEEELKDKDTVKPVHYPDNVIRPNLGCRTLVHRSLSKLLPPLSRELSDWLPDVRVKSAQLLCMLLLNAERQMTQQLAEIVAALCRGAADEDARVRDNIDLAARYLGCFVPCDVTWQIFKPTLSDASASQLRVLAEVLAATKPAGLLTQLPDIAAFLASCSAVEANCQRPLLHCCRSLLQPIATHGVELSPPITTQLYSTAVSVLGLAASEQVCREADGVLCSVAKCSGLQSALDLHRLHAGEMLQRLSAASQSWSAVSSGWLVYSTLLTEAGRVLESELPGVFVVLAGLAEPAVEPNLRLSMLIMLGNLMTEVTLPPELLNSVVTTVLGPSLVWRAGRTEEAIRTAAASCLARTLVVGAAVDEDMVARLLPLVVDSGTKTRLVAVKAVATVAHRLDDDQVVRVYPEVCKRLDDASNAVRSAAVNCLQRLFASRAQLSETHFSSAFNSMLIHCDDQEQEFTATLADALKEMGRVHPKLLLDKITASKQNFRNTQICTELETFLTDVLNSQPASS